MWASQVPPHQTYSSMSLWTWNRKGPTPNYFHVVGSITWSKMYGYAEAESSLHQNQTFFLATTKPRLIGIQRSMIRHSRKHISIALKFSGWILWMERCGFWHMGISSNLVVEECLASALLQQQIGQRPPTDPHPLSLTTTSCANWSYRSLTMVHHFGCFH